MTKESTLKYDIPGIITCTRCWGLEVSVLINTESRIVSRTLIDARGSKARVLVNGSSIHYKFYGISKIFRSRSHVEVMGSQEQKCMSVHPLYMWSSFK